MAQILQISNAISANTRQKNPSANPVDAFLGRLGIGSRRGIRIALNNIAGYLSNGTKDADELDWASIGYEEASRVRESLLKRFAARTVNFHLSAFRGVLKEVWRMGDISNDEFARATDLKQVRGDDHAAGRVLSHGELVALIRVCLSDRSTTGRRDAAIVAMLYGTGLRRTELTSLNWEDYNEDAGTLIVQGKGNRVRLAYMVGEARTVMAGWIAVRGNSPGPLFLAVTKAGNLKITRLTGGAIWQLLRRRGIQAGIPDFSPHDIRRTTATDLLESGIDISVVQKFLGHQNLATTTLYDRRGEASKKKAAACLPLPITR